MKKQFQVTSHGKKFDFNTEDWTDEALLSHTIRGIKQRLADSSASLTKKTGFTDEQRLEACSKLAARIQAGEVITGGGGGGSRMSLEDRALKTSLQSVTTFLKKESLEAALERYTKVLATNQEVEFNPEMVTKVVTMLEGSDIYKNVIEADKAKNKTADMMAGLSF